MFMGRDYPPDSHPELLAVEFRELAHLPDEAVPFYRAPVGIHIGGLIQSGIVVVLNDITRLVVLF